MLAITRDKHTNAQAIVDVPDEASLVLIELARHHAKDRTLWPSPTDFATWTLEQGDVEGWRLLGSTTAYGGSLSENGVELETSWDETPLRTYRIEVGSWTQYVHDAAALDHLLKRLAKEGHPPATVTRLRNRQVRVWLIAHQGPIDTHVKVTAK